MKSMAQKQRNKNKLAFLFLVRNGKIKKYCPLHVNQKNQYCPYCYPIVIDLMQRGLLTSRGIVTHRFALGEWEAAFALANSLDSIKVLLQPERT